MKTKINILSDMFNMFATFTKNKEKAAKPIKVFNLWNIDASRSYEGLFTLLSNRHIYDNLIVRFCLF